MKVLGCVDIQNLEFEYGFEDVLESRSYMAFLEIVVSKFFEKNKRIHYIQDNASYHKDGDIWRWFKKNRKWIEVYNLPPYCPELNATERLWKFIRKQGTHNKYFDTTDLLQENLVKVFEEMNKPEIIQKNIRSFL